MALEHNYDDSWKYSVIAASTTPVNINSILPIIDGYQTKRGDRVLLKNQTDATKNGIYVVNSNNLVQDTDSINANSYVNGASVRVHGGSTNINTEWYLAPIPTNQYNLTAKIWVISPFIISPSGSNYLFTTVTAADIIDNGVFYASGPAGNLAPIYTNLPVVKVDIIPLQANEVITEIFMSCSEAFTLSQFAIDNYVNHLMIYTRSYSLLGYQDLINVVPSDINPFAPSAVNRLNEVGKFPLYTYKTNVPYNYSLFFTDDNSMYNAKDIITNETGVLNIWYKKETLLIAP